MAPTPTPKSNIATPLSKTNTPHHHSKTPQSKHRLNFNLPNAPMEHPVEVIGRIRDYPDLKNKPNANPTALQINADGKSLRMKTDIGYRDFSLDGVSFSEEDDLEVFYRKFVESRINGVKMGQKCTVMMYGPTGSGKSHTMFGCSKQPGIVYNALKAILGHEVEGEGERLGPGTFVQVTVLEIYNEEIYDLLSSGSNGGGFGLGWGKGGSASKVRLEVMGKKAKNASFISGNEAGKILKEIQKVEKRRIVKSTLCNERSSRSHCMIIVDVPTVGGRLMLVDMAGSENIEQAGQNGLEAKMQTAKINQGNIALKRVVESIANNDSHVPFRDSKLTMLLQDSFEDDKSKILMILCASPDPKELHKTIATLEYGAKAKCIVRGPHTPNKDKGADDSSSAIILGSRIEALDQFVCKLQIENRLKEKERKEAQKELKKREEEISLLKTKLAMAEEKRVCEEELDLKVNERTRMLKIELERKLRECQKMADEFVEKERLKMEEMMLRQRQEVETLMKRLEDIECELRFSKAENSSVVIEGGGFMKRLMEASCLEDSDMVKSMDLVSSIDLEPSVVRASETIGANAFHHYTNNYSEGVFYPLTTVYEEEEEDEEYKNDKGNDLSDEVVEKEVIEEKKIITTQVSVQNPEISLLKDFEPEDSEYSRQIRIQNIFTLCGNYRELSQHGNEFEPSNNLLEINSEDHSMAQTKTVKEDMKENENPLDENSSDGIEVFVKWEASRENPGKYITTLKVLKDSTLADLRKLIEIYLGGEQQAFTFLVLKDPSGAPVPKEDESTTQTTKLPICNNLLNGRLACLRASKPIEGPRHIPFSPLENKMPKTPNASHLLSKGDDYLSPNVAENLNSPFITIRRY